MSKNKNDNIFFSRKLLRSKAYHTLSGTSIKILNFFFMKRQMKKVRSMRSEEWQIINNGEIVFTYSEAVKLGFTRPQFKRALDQLVLSGFVDIEHHGGGMNKDFSKYSLSGRWESFDTDDFVKKTIPKDTRGLGFKKQK